VNRNSAHCNILLKKKDNLNVNILISAKLKKEFLQIGIMTMKLKHLSEISGSHGGKYEDDNILEYCAV
jgi:hypothetical protein